MLIKKVSIEMYQLGPYRANILPCLFPCKGCLLIAYADDMGQAHAMGLMTPGAEPTC